MKALRLTASYTRADNELSAAVDEVRKTLSGPTTILILEREHSECGTTEYKR